MSMPLNFEEGQFQSTIPRCEHGIYSPEGKGKPSRHCYGCTFERSKQKLQEKPCQ